LIFNLFKISTIEKCSQKPLLCVADASGYSALDKTLKCLKDEKAKGGNVISFKELTHEDLKKDFPQAKFTEDQRGIVEYSAGILFADKCMATLQVCKKFEKGV
jgi:hypothetical protein